MHPMAELAPLDRRGAIGLLPINNPPLNALSAAAVAAMISALDDFERNDSLAALVAHCDGGAFVAGGDVTAFDSPDFSPGPYNAFLRRLEAGARPVASASNLTLDALV
jgi:3-hydroxyacyl-CoA dehydrogenase